MARRIRDPSDCEKWGNVTSYSQYKRKHDELYDWQWEQVRLAILGLSHHFKTYAIPSDLFLVLTHFLWRLLYLREVKLCIYVGPRRYGDRLWDGSICFDFWDDDFTSVCHRVGSIVFEKAIVNNPNPNTRSTLGTLTYSLGTFHGGYGSPLMNQGDLILCIKHINWYGHTDRAITLFYELKYPQK